MLAYDTLWIRGRQAGTEYVTPQPVVMGAG